MSEVTRWTFPLGITCSDCNRLLVTLAHADDEGKWVKHADYAAIERENAALRAEVVKLKHRAETWEQLCGVAKDEVLVLRAEVERLKVALAEINRERVALRDHIASMGVSP